MTDPHLAAITIRQLGPGDDRALAALAQRDSARVPAGRLLGALVEDRLLAAHSLDGEGAIAEPFSRTDELRGLLELRVAQLRRREHTRGRRSWRRPRARAAPAGPPQAQGAGGSLVTLPR